MTDLRFPIRGRYYEHYKHDPEKDTDDGVYEVASVSIDHDGKYLVNLRPIFKSAFALLDRADLRAIPLSDFMGIARFRGRSVERYRLLTNQDRIDRLHFFKKQLYGADK